MNLNSKSLKYHLPPSNSRGASSFSANIHYPYPNSPFPLPKPGVCRASQVAELFPSITPEIVVREARLEDCWGVAETHCSSFFPNYSFPINVLLRMNKLIGLVFGFSVPNGCKKTCLVAERTIAAEKVSFQLQMSGIAYISNVAVRENLRGKGIAKKLVAKAENQARTWGCRAIALHCDSGNPGATKLYMGRGFRIIKVPEGANWPEPRASRGVQFSFMMKLLDAR
nr:FkbH domain containing protein [Ipomoea batatas]